MTTSTAAMSKTKIKDEAKELILHYIDNVFYALSDNSYGYSEKDLELLEEEVRIQRKRVIKFFGYSE